MAYIRLSDGTYPLSEAQVRADFPNKTFPSPLPCPDGYSVVFDAPRPSFNPITHCVVEVDPAIVSGRYVQQFSVTALPSDIVAANQAKAVNDLIESIQNQTQARLDSFARTRMYDDIKSLSDYAGDLDAQFNKEGTYGKMVRSQTWRTLITIMDDVKAGRRAMPSSFAAIELELPVLEWPA